MHGCSPIHEEKSLRVSNRGDKSVPYFQEEKGPFPVDWRTTMHANGFLMIFQECGHTHIFIEQYNNIVNKLPSHEWSNKGDKWCGARAPD